MIKILEFWMYFMMESEEWGNQKAAYPDVSLD